MSSYKYYLNLVRSFKSFVQLTMTIHENGSICIISVLLRSFLRIMSLADLIIVPFKQCWCHIFTIKLLFNVIIILPY
jgi:hypothetical protein